MDPTTLPMPLQTSWSLNLQEVHGGTGQGAACKGLHFPSKGRTEPEASAQEVIEGDFVGSVGYPLCQVCLHAQPAASASVAGPDFRLQRTCSRAG